MEITITKSLVHTILRHADDYPWRLQDTGLLAFWLGDHTEYRLHVWDPTDSRALDGPAIHDHPFDLISVAIAGETRNTL